MNKKIIISSIVFTSLLIGCSSNQQILKELKNKNTNNLSIKKNVSSIDKLKKMISNKKHNSSNIKYRYMGVKIVEGKLLSSIVKELNYLDKNQKISLLLKNMNYPIFKNIKGDLYSFKDLQTVLLLEDSFPFYLEENKEGVLMIKEKENFKVGIINNTKDLEKVIKNKKQIEKYVLILKPKKLLSTFIKLDKDINKNDTMAIYNSLKKILKTKNYNLDYVQIKKDIISHNTKELKELKKLF